MKTPGSETNESAMRKPNALVTGAAARLGRDMARALAREGFNVAVHHLSTPADRIVSDIRAMGCRAISIKADLLDESETRNLLPVAAEALGGPISVLVNNASIFEYDSIETATRRSWDRHIESNLRAPFVLIQALAAQAPGPTRDEMGELRAEALAINMIDQRVRKLTPEFMTYTIAKAALWTLTRSAAQALAPRIRVNAIGPGPTLRGHRQSAEHFARQRATTILGRGANSEDIIEALRYFLHAPAVTGQLLCVDGGQHIGWAVSDDLDSEPEDGTA
ncbi:MAG: SDR family oxidoreductase [Rhodobacter sp.]|nr:SDR family oxidoreductase [Rhodobacter sp.]